MEVSTKPQILIVMHYMELGGAETALLGLLQSHNPQYADIDLFLFAHRGEMMDLIPRDKVNVLQEIPVYSQLETPIKEVLKKGFFRLAWSRLKGKRDSKNYAHHNVKHLFDFSSFTFQQYHTVSVLPDINPSKNYDLAISFITPHYIVLDKVRAKKKLGWIHTDYTSVFTNIPMELQMWNRLDYIASISEEVGNKFCEVFPQLKEKVLPIENILSSFFIRKRASEFIQADIKKEPGVVNLLSIGRFCHQKRFECVGTMCKIVNEHLSKISSIRVKWYIIGYGTTAEEIKILNNIREEEVQDSVILLGKRTNPYPFLSACDIYIQPSRYEGKSITVREAQILGKPVIVSNYPTASSQINHGVDGFIVPFDIERGAEEIARIIANNAVIAPIVEWVSCHDFGNEQEIQKIYSLLS